MKRLLFTLALVVAVALIVVSVPSAQAAPPQSVESKGKPGACTTVQSGELSDSSGDPILPGYNHWGYNYQGHMFNGLYCDSYHDAAWCQPYKDVKLSEKWNEAWLSNKDCDGDGKLDRHPGFPAYLGSGAWLTNHQSGEDVDADGKACKWNYFVKIVAAPANATLDAGVWYAANGKEIGAAIWGEFAVIQEVYNDGCLGIHGAQYVSPYSAGFGVY